MLVAASNLGMRSGTIPSGSMDNGDCGTAVSSLNVAVTGETNAGESGPDKNTEERRDPPDRGVAVVGVVEPLGGFDGVVIHIMGAPAVEDRREIMADGVGGTFSWSIGIDDTRGDIFDPCASGDLNPGRGILNGVILK